MAVFEGLAEAIEGLDIPPDGAALVQVLALRDRLRRPDRAGGGRLRRRPVVGCRRVDVDDGVVEIVGVDDVEIGPRSGVDGPSAAEVAGVRVGLRATGVVGWPGGGDPGQPLRRHGGCCSPRQESELVPYLVPLTVAGCARAMASWKEQAQRAGRAGGAGAVVAPVRRPSTVVTCWRVTSTPRVERWWPPPCAWPRWRIPTARPAQRRADALVEICRFFLDHQQSRPGGRHRPHLNVVVDLEALQEDRGGRVVDGPSLDATTMSRLVCDCALHRVLTRGRSAILDYGTSTRTIPAPLWSALVLRDEHCRFPGCDRPSTWCEGHHIHWVTHGGATELGQPGPRVLPAPPPAPRTRLAGQAPARRHLRGHRPRRHGAGHVATTIGARVVRAGVARRGTKPEWATGARRQVGEHVRPRCRGRRVR